MAYRVRYRGDEHFVDAAIGGEVDLLRVHRYAREIIAQLSAHHCLRLLNDMRKASVKIPTVDIYDLPAWIEDAGMDRRCKRALLVARDFRDYEFFETVARNHGHLVEVFTNATTTGIFRDRAAAYEWLGLKTVKPVSARKRPVPGPSDEAANSSGPAE